MVLLKIESEELPVSNTIIIFPCLTVSVDQKLKYFSH